MRRMHGIQALQYQCWSDGSFDRFENGGAAYILQSKGILMRYEFVSSVGAVSPFHMEVTALLMVLEAVSKFYITNCVFYSDSLLLVQMVNPRGAVNNLQAADWTGDHIQNLSVSLIF